MLESPERLNNLWVSGPTPQALTVLSGDWLLSESSQGSLSVQDRKLVLYEPSWPQAFIRTRRGHEIFAYARAPILQDVYRCLETYLETLIYFYQIHV